MDSCSLIRFSHTNLKYLLDSKITLFYIHSMNKKLHKTFSLSKLLEALVSTNMHTAFKNKYLIFLLTDFYGNSCLKHLWPNSLFKHEKRVFNIENSVFWLKSWYMPTGSKVKIYFCTCLKMMNKILVSDLKI